MNMIGWRAYYVDGRDFSSQNATPDDLPRTGLQAIVVYLDQEHAPGKPYREVLWGADYIVWNGHQWQNAMDPPECPTCLIFPGIGSPDDEFEALQQRALAAETL